MPVTNKRWLLPLSMVLLSSAGQTSPVEQGASDFQKGHYKEAARELRGTTDPQGRLFLGLSLAALNDCSGALPALSPFSKNDRLAAMAAAKCYAASHDDASALGILQDMRKQYPGDADLLYETAEIEMRAFNETTFAMFERVPSSYRVHELSAEIFEVQNRFDDAVAEYNKAIGLNATALGLHFRLGRALLMGSHSTEATAKAKAAFEAELRLSPEDASCEYQLGQIASAEGSQTDAQRSYERAIALSPDFAAALVALGRIYSQTGKNGQAIPLLERAAKLQPDNEAAHYALLAAYRNGGQMDKAREEKAILDRLQKPPEGEFTDFLKKLGDKPQQ